MDLHSLNTKFLMCCAYNYTQSIQENFHFFCVTMNARLLRKIGSMYTHSSAHTCIRGKRRWFHIKAPKAEFQQPLNGHR